MLLITVKGIIRNNGKKIEEIHQHFIWGGNIAAFCCYFQTWVNTYNKNNPFYIDPDSTTQKNEEIECIVLNTCGLEKLPGSPLKNHPIFQSSELDIIDLSEFDLS